MKGSLYPPEEWKTELNEIAKSFGLTANFNTG